MRDFTHGDPLKFDPTDLTETGVLSFFTRRPTTTALACSGDRIWL
jgi:hypothetical protein